MHVCTDQTSGLYSHPKDGTRDAVDSEPKHYQRAIPAPIRMMIIMVVVMDVMIMLIVFVLVVVMMMMSMMIKI